MNRYQDEITTDEENSAQFKKFLKKTEESTSGSQKQGFEHSRPKTSRGKSLPDTKYQSHSGNSLNKQTNLSLSAINRFNDLETRIRQRQSNFKALNLSNSDYDIDLSSDYDVKESVGKGHIKLRNNLKPQNVTQSNNLNINLADFSSSEDDSSAKFRFVKKETLSKTTASDTDSTVDSEYSNRKRNRTKHSTPSKKVSFVSPTEVSLDDFMPQQSFSETHSISSLDDFNPSANLQNVLTLDDLIVADPLDLKPATGSKLHHSSDFEMSTDSDIKTESTHQNFLNIQSIEDLQAFNEPIQESIKTEEGKLTEEVSEHYTDDFDNDTLKETDSIVMDSIEEEIDSIKTDSNISESISQKSSTQSTLTEQSYSSVTASDDYTEELPDDTREQINKLSAQNVKKDANEIGTQTSSNEQFSFAPSRLIDNDAIDVLTNYNPATLAIHDLLKEQVSLTKEFMAQSKRMHELATDSIPCDYVYGAIDLNSLERFQKILNK